MGNVIVTLSLELFLLDFCARIFVIDEIIKDLKRVWLIQSFS